MIKIQYNNFINNCSWLYFILGHFRYQLFWLPVTFILLEHGFGKTLVVVATLILGRSRYQLFQLPVSFFLQLSCFFFSGTCSFLDAPFFTAKVFLGGTCYWSNISMQKQG